MVNKEDHLDYLTDLYETEYIDILDAVDEDERFDALRRIKETGRLISELYGFDVREEIDAAVKKKYEKRKGLAR